MIVVSDAFPNSSCPRIVALPFDSKFILPKLRLVPVAAPNTGVTNVGLVANTAEPLPVSSVSAADKLAELKEPNVVAVPTDVIAPVRLGILVVDDAVPVRLPTKPEVAVIIPDALILVATNEVTVETPEELMLPVTLPVRFPEKPLVAVITPVIITLSGSPI